MYCRGVKIYPTFTKYIGNSYKLINISSVRSIDPTSSNEIDVFKHSTITIISLLLIIVLALGSVGFYFLNFIIKYGTHIISLNCKND